jgi:TonB family protein
LEEPPRPPVRSQPQTAIEALRSQVRQPPEAPAESRAAAPQMAAPNPLADLARRRYRGGIQTRVRENHTYPAEFDCGIEALVRITLGRDGNLLESELLKSSGDPRYDYAVDLTIRATRFAPLPEELPGQTFTENLRFTPKRCPSASP